MASHAPSIAAIESPAELSPYQPHPDTMGPTCDSKAFPEKDSSFIKATINWLVRGVANFRDMPWRRRSQKQAFANALLALGQRMYLVGIDDGEIGAKITARNDHMSTAQSDALIAECRGLYIDLALAALEDDGPLPGAEEEYEAARQQQKRLQIHETT